MGLKVQIKKQLASFLLDVTFEGEEGMLAMVGNSGCGKSMTLKCIAGIETPDEGYIQLDGRVLYDSEKRINLPPQKRNIGYMFQDYALFPHMTVRKNILSGMTKTPRDMKKQQAEELMKRFCLLEFADCYPEKLSGGQKQRVAMARLLAAKPELILLDEPFSAMDQKLKTVLEEEMKKTLQEENVLTILVTHNQDEVARLSKNVCRIVDGKMGKVLPVEKYLFT